MVIKSLIKSVAILSVGYNIISRAAAISAARSSNLYEQSSESKRFQDSAQSKPFSIAYRSKVYICCRKHRKSPLARSLYSKQDRPKSVAADSSIEITPKKEFIPGSSNPNQQQVSDAIVNGSRVSTFSCLIGFIQ